ncbi:glucosaminidase domain-containing protein [Acetonema longum]|uniref:Mannosyl-glycoprotein endo-beta-N-acetylglucosamidase-like domain-containing protein n=1 Tax=Acetonema longum DSM 6540 TaxID=1009370 RepID=F7NG71_9FIRM|nr:glucosaminidase domain-containing protein [Acetonema longum]EGO64989.1 hypothetical protein ALO_05288 [Acetonema longum DSM 6540]
MKIISPKGGNGKRCSWIHLAVLAAACWLAGGNSAVAADLYGHPVHWEMLRTETPMDLTIHGEPIATQEQCLQYLLRRNSLPFLTVSPAQLVEYYYREAGREGIRPDVAFAQALHETGNFRYGGDVVPLQNNYCGLGTTGGGVKGAWFSSAEIGVRAQIQHLLAYSATRPPIMPVVDPRYHLVKKTAYFGQMVTWTDLNGKWAVPGRTYGQRILTIHEWILTGK